METIRPELYEAVRFLLYLAGSLVGFFLVRTLVQLDRNQKELFDKIACLTKDFYIMKGEHEQMKYKCYGQQAGVVGRE